jgi:hypothetical protein
MSQQLFQNLMGHSDLSIFPQELLNHYSPAEIRETISHLVANKNVPMAEALSAAAISLYPESEDVLAIASLVAMLSESWDESVSHLRKLISVQGDRSPVTTHLMLVRALRCSLEPAEALNAVIAAHEKFPESKELETEFKALSAQFGMLED